MVRRHPNCPSTFSRSNTDGFTTPFLPETENRDEDTRLDTGRTRLPSVFYKLQPVNDSGKWLSFTPSTNPSGRIIGLLRPRRPRPVSIVSSGLRTTGNLSSYVRLHPSSRGSDRFSWVPKSQMTHRRVSEGPGRIGLWRREMVLKLLLGT